MPQQYEFRHDAFLITTDPARIDVDVVHAFLRDAYWCRGLPRGVLERSIAHSMCFSVIDESKRPPAQVGIARVITDRATYAYLADVFILESSRGRGLSKRLMEAILGHPELQGLRRFCLMTRDAHGLYEQFGFGYLADPKRYMEIIVPDIYQREVSPAGSRA